jgi:hypothetical protein
MSSVKQILEGMIEQWFNESETLSEEGFITVVKNGDRGYLPRRKKREGDEWKDYNISHFPTEKAAKDWVKKDNPGAKFV